MNVDTVKWFKDRIVSDQECFNGGFILTVQLLFVCL